MENKKRGSIFYIFLPVMVLYVIQTGMSFFVSQIAVAIIAKEKGPLKFTELLTALINASVSERFTLVYTLSAAVVSLIVFFVWYRRLLKNGDGNVIEINLTRPLYPAVILGAILVAVGGQFVLTFLAEVIIKLMPGWLIEYDGVLETLGMSADSSFVISIPTALYVVFLAPIMEELLFRGLCLKYSLRCFGARASILICSLFFGMMHGNPLQGIVTFMFALVLGYICYKTETVWIAIIIHIGFNGLSYFVPEFVSLTQKPVADFVILFTSMVAVYLGVGCILKGYVSGNN